MQQATRFNLFYAVIAISGVMLIHDFWVGRQAVTPIPYSQFQTLVREGKAKGIVITQNEIRGEFTEPASPRKRYFATTRVDPQLAEQLGDGDQLAIGLRVQHARACVEQRPLRREQQLGGGVHVGRARREAAGLHLHRPPFAPRPVRSVRQA